MRAALAVAIVFCLVPAFAEPSDPSRREIVRAAQSCTAEGAFGHRFGEVHYGVVEAKADALWAPFAKLWIYATADNDPDKPDATYGITGFAFFGKEPEDRTAQAAGFLAAVDHEVQASHRFARREELPNGALYSSGSQTGFTLEIVRYDASVVLSCMDLARQPSGDLEF